HRVQRQPMPAQLTPEPLGAPLAGDAHGGASALRQPLLALLDLLDQVAWHAHRPRTTVNSVNPAYSPMRWPVVSSITTVTSWWFCSAGSMPVSGESTSMRSD